MYVFLCLLTQKSISSLIPELCTRASVTVDTSKMIKNAA